MTPIDVVVLPAPRHDDPPTRIAARSREARLARDAAAREAGCTVTDFPQAPDGRPLPSAGWSWSISHGRDWVAGTVHTGPVGVDVERLHLRPRVVARVLAPAEAGHFGDTDPTLAFIRTWTAKEAVVKASGVGIRDLPACTVEDVEGPERLWIRCHGERLRVEQRVHDGHVLAVHAPGDGWSVRWHLPGPA